MRFRQLSRRARGLARRLLSRPTRPAAAEVIAQPAPPEVAPPVAAPVPALVKLAAASIYFDFDSAELGEPTRAALQSFFDLAQQGYDQAIRIEETATSAGRASTTWRWAAPRRRSEEVPDRSRTSGKPHRHHQLRQGAAARSGHDEEAWRENRRDDLVRSARLRTRSAKPRADRIDPVHRSRVEICISEVSVLWTGQRSAISSSRARCASSRAPSARSRARSDRSPSLVSQSGNRERGSSRGSSALRRQATAIPLCRAYICSVIAVQLAQGGDEKVVGRGPRIGSPRSSGSSETR